MPTISIVSPLLIDALLDAAGRDGAAAGDREDVLDRHQERLVELAHGLGDVAVERVGELEDLLLVLLVALERLERRTRDERDVVTREVVFVEQLADLDLDEFEQLLVVDHVGLVEEHDDVGHADLAGEQDVLTRLGHRAVGGRDDEDRAVHLGGARDHVLHVVGVARAVDVRVVAGVGLVLDVRGCNRDPAFLLLGSVVDLREAAGFRAALLGEHRRDCSRQRRLAMVDVTDGPDVDMGLVALKLLLRHFLLAPYRLVRPPMRANLENLADYGRLSVACCNFVGPTRRSGTRPCAVRRSSRRCWAGPHRRTRTASCKLRGPACLSAGRSRSRTSR